MIARAQHGLIRGFSQRIAFLPEPVRNFVRRRFAEAIGLLLLATGLAFAISLIGYNSLDPSLNNASAAATKNPLGFYGAIVSDISLQYFGLAAALPAIALLAWGVRLLRHRRVARFGWRLLAVLVATCESISLRRIRT